MKQDQFLLLIAVLAGGFHFMILFWTAIALLGIKLIREKC